MTMMCPTCPPSLLRPGKLDYALPAWGCTECGGHLIDLLAFRAWSERQAGNLTREWPRPVQDTEGNCPRCASPFAWHRVPAAKSGALVGICQGCATLWSGGAGLDLLVRADWARAAPQILGEPWVRIVRRELTFQTAEMRFRAKLAEADYTLARQARDWLRAHPQRFDIIDYLNRAVRDD